MLALAVLIALRGQDETERLLSKTALTCRDWALAANESIALGEARAVAWLKAPPKGGRARSFLAGESLTVRKGLLCRLLFVPKRAAALRPPGFGGLGFLPDLPLSRWPEYPFAKQDGVWFLLSEFYILAGDPESTARYVDYCRKEGAFRRIPFAVPTSVEAARALDRLQASPRWKAIRWSDEGPGWRHTIVPDFVLKPIKAQARF